MEENTDLGEIITKESLVVNGQLMPMLKTYKDANKSLEIISNNSIIKYISDKKGYETIDASNWKDYEEEIYTGINECEWSSHDYLQVMRFIDIYENEEENTEVITKINKTNKLSDVATNKNLLENLPYKTAQSLQKNNLKGAMLSSNGFDV